MSGANGSEADVGGYQGRRPLNGQHGRVGREVSRREFLKWGVAIGGGAALTPLANACRFGRSQPTGVATATPPQAPRRGGVLRVGLIGGSPSTDTLDPSGEGSAELQQSFKRNVYSRLTDMAPDGSFQGQLAESMEPNATSDEWVVRLRRGVEFHDGKTLTADDVIYSLRRILDPANGLESARPAIEMIDPGGLEKIDEVTLRIRLLRPWSDLPAAVGQRWINIIKEGTRPPFTVENTIGTGPFKLTGWRPGREYTYEAFNNYFEQGKPYLDGMVILGIPDPVARVNALVSGEVDAICDVPPAQIPVIEGAGLKVFVEKAGSWIPIYMNTQAGPFRDVRVRQAFKHLIDREQSLESGASGYGELANDIFGRWDPLYASDLPQRTFDPERARSLLADAGYLAYEFTLYASDAVSDMLPLALVLQQGAKQAGIKVDIRKVPADSYWSDVYGKQPFAFSSWGYRPLLAQWVQSFRVWNKEETNWTDPSAQRANDLIRQVAATVDENRRKELAHQAQEILWQEGGYIIPYFKSPVDALSPSVRGLVPHPFPFLGWYQFWDVWLD